METFKKILKICGKVLLGIVIALLVILLIVWLFLKFYPSVGKTPNKEMQESFAQKTDRFYDVQFHNENEFTVMTGEAQKKSDRTTPKEKIPAVKNTDIEICRAEKIFATRTGHG